jgi:Domain of unknown function (DUF5060)
LLVASLLASVQRSYSSPGVVQLNPARLWQRLEFEVTNVPAASNPFDPNLIRLEGTFTLPSGRTIAAPAFWYQGYTRSLSGGYENDTPLGLAGWRLRFTPPEAGACSLSLLIRTNGEVYGSAIVVGFDVPATPAPARFGYVGIAPGNRYFQTGDGQPLPLKGEDVAWPGNQGTYDYDTWFGSMQAVGENFARVWMWPWSFGIEDGRTNLNRYSLGPAWQLDYVLQLAEQKGIYLQLALDYHGMFATQPDYWGGNNFWPQNPYNTTNGGPCAVANDFFTSASAAEIYQKRLRYLIGRYGYSQNLLGWEFFNEIDNDYTFLNAANVAAWHGVMGAWMRTNDVFGHLVTTSLSSSSGHPEIWSLPQIDYVSDHSYNEASPSISLASEVQGFRTRYGKPVMIGEFGTSWQGWNRSNDPYLRGLRQGIWGGALGGSAGTAMSWYWQNIAAEDDYSLYSAVGSVLNGTGWGRGQWTNVTFLTSGQAPVTVGALIGGQPFNVELLLDNNWGDMVGGQFAIPNPQAAGTSAGVLNSFVHGSSHAELRTPFRLSAWFTNNASLVMHLNSVSWGAILAVRVDGLQQFSTNLPNLDGGTSVDGEYNLAIPVNLPAGKHLVEITNAGSDWFYLDWVDLNEVLPSAYAGGWQPSVAAIGLQGARETLLYIVAPWVSFPAGATNASLPLQQTQTVCLADWPGGDFIAEWHDPPTGALIAYSRATTTNRVLTVPLPDFREDLAGIVYRPPILRVAGISAGNGLQLRLESRTGGRCVMEQSTDLAAWTAFLTVTNTTGTLILQDPSVSTNARSFIRALQMW